MTRRPWFRPVIGLLVALAVGVAAVFIGFQFAPKEQIVQTPVAVTPPVTVSAPIVQPIATGEEQPSADPNADGTFGVGDATGTTEVPVPDGHTSDGSDAVDAYTDAEAHADDPVRHDIPGSDVIPYVSDDDTADPCSPADGSDPPADCPDGIHGVVLPLIHVDDFGTVVWIDPPTAAQVDAGDDSTHGRSCEFSDDGLHALVLETIPADLQLVISSTSTTSHGVINVEVSSTDLTVTGDQRDAYTSSLGSAADFFDVDFPTFCVTLDSSLPDGNYIAEARGTDDAGRAAGAAPGAFTLPLATSVHPEISVRTIGQSLVLASAVHSPDETVTFKVQAGPGTLPSTACDNDGTVDLEPLTTAEADADPAYLAAIHAPAADTRKTVNAYSVPEGSTIVFCARWWPGGDAPSWQTAQWTYTSFVDVHSPDRILPTVTLEAVTPVSPDLQNLYVNGSTMEGVTCDTEAAWALGAEIDGDHDDICRASDGEQGSAYTYGDGYLRDPGFSGDLALQVHATFRTGEETDNWVFLDLSRNMCTGVCRLPHSTHYFLPIGALDSGSCGVFTGADCQPVTTTTVGGAAMVKVSWSQGNRNGLTSFQVGTPLGTTQDVVAADHTQLDTHLGWRDLRVDPGTLQYGGYLDVAADRASTVIPRLVLSPGSASIPGGCAVPGGGLPGDPLTMTAGVRQSIHFERLTAGCSYQVELTVRDGTARTGGVIWGLFPGAANWDGVAVDVPLIPVSLEAIVVFNEQHAHIRRMEMTLGGIDLGLPEGGCTIADGSYVSSRTYDTALPATLPLAGVVDVRVEPPCNDLAARTTGPSSFTGPTFTLQDLLRSDIETGHAVFTTFDVNGERVTVLLEAHLRG